MASDRRLVIHGPPEIIDALKADLQLFKVLWDDDDLYRQSKNPNHKPSESSLGMNALILLFKKLRGEVP